MDFVWFDVQLYCLFVEVLWPFALAVIRRTKKEEKTEDDDGEDEPGPAEDPDEDHLLREVRYKLETLCRTTQ